MHTNKYFEEKNMKNIFSRSNKKCTGNNTKTQMQRIKKSYYYFSDNFFPCYLTLPERLHSWTSKLVRFMLLIVFWLAISAPRNLYISKGSRGCSLFRVQKGKADLNCLWASSDNDSSLARTSNKKLRVHSLHATFQKRNKHHVRVYIGFSNFHASILHCYNSSEQTNLQSEFEVIGIDFFKFYLPIPQTPLPLFPSKLSLSPQLFSFATESNCCIGEPHLAHSPGALIVRSD